MGDLVQLGVLTKVLAYAIVPLVMALMGNRLAAEAIPDVHRRRRYNVAFAVFLILGVAVTWLVESQADRDHRKELATHATEVQDNKRSIAALAALIESRQKDSNNVIATLADSLTTKLDTLAAVNSQGIKKEVSSQLAAAESVSALTTKTHELVADLRRFGSDYSRRIAAIGKGSWTADSTTVTADSAATTVDSSVSYLTDSSGRVLTDSSGVPLVVAKESTAQLQLAAAERAEFNAKYLARAVALRDQLLVRLAGAAQLKNFPPGRLIAFNGYLTAPSSVMDAADYLDALANLLPPTTLGR